MIVKVHARNYRSLGDVEVELGPLTVLVGPNGSGKSNFVDVLHFLTDTVTHGVDTAVMDRRGIQEVRRWAPRRPHDIELAIGFREVPVRNYGMSANTPGEGEYGFAIRSIRGAQYEVRREYLSINAGEAREWFQVDRGKVTRCSEDYLVGDSMPPTSLLLRLFPGLRSSDLELALRDSRFHSIHLSVLRDPQKASHDRLLDSHGRNLYSVLRRMRKAQPGPLPDLIAALRHVVPGIRDVKVSQIGGYCVLKLLHDQGNGQAHWFLPTQESDGTLRVLAVLAALCQDPAPDLVAIEEPELTVHPGMLPLLRDCIEEASRRTQVIITTHSPDLMSLFDVDALRVVEMTPEGTKIGAVADWQRQAIRDRLFSPGEIMRMEGLQMAPSAE